MATISAKFATDEVTLTSTTADTVILADTGAHKVLISNISGATTLHATLDTVGSVKSQGELTLDANPSDDVASQGTFTLTAIPLTTETVTIDGVVYTFQTTLTEGANNVAIGGSEAQAKLNLVAAISNTGTPGTDYAFAVNRPHPTVTVAAFAGSPADDMVATAITPGVAGDSITTTETSSVGSWDAATLGTTTAGTAADTMTIDTVTYTFKDTLTSTTANQVKIGANLAATQASVETLFDISGTAGTDYSHATKAHPSVTIAAFATDAAVLTATQSGRPGDAAVTNAIVTTETFLGSSVFDATTMGTETLGVDPAPVTATAAVDRFMIPAGLTLELNAKAYGVAGTGLRASIVGNANVYAVQLVK